MHALPLRLVITHFSPTIRYLSAKDLLQVFIGGADRCDGKVLHQEVENFGRDKVSPLHLMYIAVLLVRSGGGVFPAAG
jgi:hypothetical protein